MRIYTSSYWKYSGTRGVQISNSKPEQVKVYRSLPMLYPSWPAVKAWNQVKKLSKSDAKRQKVWERFTEEYWTKLQRLGPDAVLSILSDGDVLLCWCGIYGECHRSILAEFLRRNGVEVLELSQRYTPEEMRARCVS